MIALAILGVLIRTLDTSAGAITNRSYRQADARVLPVERAMVYAPTEGWTYSHHPHLAFFRGRYYAMWSNGRESEDRPGQRVMVSTSSDFKHWEKPRPLFATRRDRYGRELILTAAGWHEYRDTLVAYAGQVDAGRRRTRLLAISARDGFHWSPVKDLGVPVNPNFGPEPTQTGRLIIAGNLAFPYTDDPTGLSGWRMAGVQPPDLTPRGDNPKTHRAVSKALDLGAQLCEGSMYQTDDARLHMMLRSTGSTWDGHLWEAHSDDDGLTWSRPAETDFSDNDAKFHFGRLPDGRFYYVGNPDLNRGERTPLVVSTSPDGLTFDRHFIVGQRPYRMQAFGRSKNGQFGYPHSIVADGYLCIIASRMKEGIEVFRVPLAELEG